MDNIITFAKKHSFILISFFYLSISLILTLYHEPWRDEAQQWLLCRDLDFIGLIKQLKYEGHFIVWYLILFPIVKLGLPYMSQNILSWFISGIGGILFLKKSTFKFWKKASFLFTPTMLYFFPSISRCYCLLPIAICLVALSYTKQKDHPLRYLLSLVFLLSIHVLLIIPVGILFLEYYFKVIKELVTCKSDKAIFKKYLIKELLYFLIIVILLIIIGLPLIGSITINKNIDRGLSISEIFAQSIISVPLNCAFYIFSYIFSTEAIYFIPLFILALFIPYIFVANKKYGIFISIIGISFASITSNTIGAQPQKIALLFSMFLLYYWIYKDGFKESSITTSLRKIGIALLIINVVFGIRFLSFDLLNNYSDCKELASYVNDLYKNGEDVLLITGNQREMITSVIPYLNNGILVYDLQFNSFNTFTTWDYHVLHEISQDDILDIRKQIPDYSNYDLYYVFMPYKTRNVSDISVVANLWMNNSITLMKKFESSYANQEKYWLFKINT